MAVVALVAAAAAVDAVRGRDAGGEAPAAETGPPAAPRAPDEPSPALVARLEREGLSGRLVLVAPDCRARSLVLPSLRPPAGEPADEAPACSAPSRRRVGGCAPEDGPGCLPAVRPGGGVAVVRDGGLWERPAECPRALGRCGRELLSAADLRRTGVAAPVVLDHAWLTESRAAVLLAWPGGGHVLGIYEGRTLVASHRWDGGTPARLEVAPGGSLFTARPARIFRSDGVPLPLAPRFRNARAVDWSPDGRWAALAMVGATVLVPTQGLRGGAEARRTIRLPHPARDLAWWPG